MSRNLYIPTVGSHIQLAEDWTFELSTEYRNESLWRYLGVEVPNYWNWRFESEAEAKADPKYQEFAANPNINLTQKAGQTYRNAYEVVATLNVTLPAGTILRMDRIYIRKNIGDFDSVTFVIENASILGDQKIAKAYARKKPRFWVRLNDANNIVMEEGPVEVEPEVKKTKVTYTVWAASGPIGHTAGHIDLTYRQIHPRTRTSKFDDDERFMARILKEFDKESIVRIRKSRDGSNNWETKWELLLDNPELAEEVREEQAVFNKAEREFYEAEYAKIQDKYGDLLNSRRGLGYYYQTLESFEAAYVNTIAGRESYL